MRLFWLLGVLLAACGGPAVYTQHRPMRFDDQAPVAPEVSLIPGDAAVLSDAEIARILDAEARLPRAPRLALVHLHHDSPDASVDSRSLPRDVGPQLVQQLRYSRRFADASYLPDFLHARAPTMGQLREAGARYQAELLFVFSTDCALSHDLGFLSDDRARARCHADAALVDVRTGLVPFVSRAERTVTLRAADQEFTLDETLRRAETRGVDAAMRANAEALVRFLSGRKPARSAEPGTGG